MVKKAEVQTVKTTEVKPVVKPKMKYRLEFEDGTIIEDSTPERAFKPNLEKHFQNTGFQVKVSDGDYNGSIMIIDQLKQKAI